ncbi:MAG: hypothetical protein AB1349_10015 [Elusimicrobiota bacterium]
MNEEKCDIVGCGEIGKIEILVGSIGENEFYATVCEKHYAEIYSTFGKKGGENR